MRSLYNYVCHPGTAFGIRYGIIVVIREFGDDVPGVQETGEETEHA